MEVERRWGGGWTKHFTEIQVASDSLLLIGGKADLWKSGKLKSDVSVMVPYQGLPLASRSLCYWRVRVWDRKMACFPMESGGSVFLLVFE